MDIELEDNKQFISNIPRSLGSLSFINGGLFRKWNRLTLSPESGPNIKFLFRFVFVDTNTGHFFKCSHITSCTLLVSYPKSKILDTLYNVNISTTTNSTGAKAQFVGRGMKVCLVETRNSMAT